MRTQKAGFSFSAGVWSPRMSMRADVPSYEEALELGQNVFVTPHGGLQMREGFRRIQSVGSAARLFSLKRGGDQSDLAVLLTDQGSPNRVELFEDEVEIAQFDDLLHPIDDDLYFHNTERLSSLTHPDHPPYLVKFDELGNYTAGHLEFAKVPRVRYFDAKSPSVAGTDSTYDITFPNDWTPGQQFVVIYGGDIANAGLQEPVIFEPAWSGDQDVNAESIRQALKGTVHLLSDAALVTVVANSLYSYTVTLEGHGAGRQMEINPRSGQTGGVGIVQTGIIVDGDEPAWSYPFVVYHTGTAKYWKCINPHYSTSDPPAETTEPGGANSVDYWEDLGATKPAYFDYQWPDGNEWQGYDGVDTELGIVYAPWDRGFPHVGVFYQQRLIFMTLDDQPTSIFGSRIGDYEDFQPGVNDSDPFFFDLDTSDSPKIKWAEPTQTALIIGTSAGDFRLGSEISLGPADIQLRKENSSRSHKTRAVSANNVAYYIEQGQRKFRATTYGRGRNAWKAEEISLTAEHLFYSQVSRVVIMHTPEMQILALRSDGNLVAMSRISTPEGDLAAFTELLTGTGAGVTHDIQDIAVCYSVPDSEDHLYALVSDSGGNLALEVMPYPDRTLEARTAAPNGSNLMHQQGVCLLDSWHSGTLTAESVITTHLEGEVMVLVDDAYIGTFTASGGLIYLDQEYTGDYVAGYFTQARFKTFEGSTGNNRGTGFGTKRRFNRLYLRLLNSALPIINGERPADRRPPSLQGISDNIIDGIYDAKISGDGYRDGVIDVIQDRPYPTHALGYLGEYEVGNS